MDLTLQEQTRRDAERVLLRRTHAQLVADLGVMVAADDVLCRIDEGTRVVLEVRAGPVRTIVEKRVIGVVRGLVCVAGQIGTGVDEVEIADLALDRQRRLDP